MDQAGQGLFLGALRRGSSSLMGWLADRRVPRPLRAAVYGGFCRLTGADAREAELPVDGYPSLGAFFVRRLKPGARAIDPDPAFLVSPCDGTIQALGRVSSGTLLQAKGQPYTLADLLGGTEAAALEDAWSATIYLAPDDYHRVHSPCEARLAGVRWLPGARRSVAPGVLERTARVLATNERAVLTLECSAGRAFLVMVGALNVGRIRVVGVDPGSSPVAPLPCVRGGELARFEMGSTVVLVVPGARSADGLAEGQSLRLGQRIARWS